MRENDMRREMVECCKNLYDRGFAAGGAGNVSLRLDENSILATPTGSCLGRLKSDELSVVDFNGKVLSGPRPSKEVGFHLALYKDPACGSVIHLHSTWTTLLSCRGNLDTGEIIRPFTPYFVMKIGKVELIPYYPPGDNSLAEELAKWAGKRRAFLLQNHGPVITGKTLTETMDLMEEFEETAKLDYLLKDKPVRYLTTQEIELLSKK